MSKILGSENTIPKNDVFRPPKYDSSFREVQLQFVAGIDIHFVYHFTVSERSIQASDKITPS